MKLEPKQESLAWVAWILIKPLLWIIFLVYQLGYLWFIFTIPNPVHQFPSAIFPHYDTYPSRIAFIAGLPGLILIFYDFVIKPKRKNRDQKKWYSAGNK
jgi:hypothetical protein